MRYNPATDNARTIESLAEESRKIIARCPEPQPLGYVWSPEQLNYVPSSK